MVGAMFIRRTQTRRTEDGIPYFSHRLVHAERLGSTVRQRTLLNLGRHFDMAQAHWPLLCARINACVERPSVAGGRLPARRRAGSAADRRAVARPRRGRDRLPDRRTCNRLIPTRCAWSAPAASVWSRSACGRSKQLGLPALADPPGRQRRPAQRRRPGPSSAVWPHPASERATHRWLQRRSGLGELLGVDFETVGAMQLYRASDALVKPSRGHRGSICSTARWGSSTCSRR